VFVYNNLLVNKTILKKMVASFNQLGHDHPLNTIGRLRCLASIARGEAEIASWLMEGIVHASAYTETNHPNLV
jgi:hypothetical protein